MDKTRPTRSTSRFNRLIEQPLLLVLLLLVFGILLILFVLVVFLLVNPFNLGRTPSFPTPTSMVKFTTPTPLLTPTPLPPGMGPSIALLPVAGEIGTLITVSGRDWPPNDTVSIRIDEPSGLQGLQPLFANALVAGNGTFVASFILQDDTGWDDLATVQVTVQSTTGNQRVAAEFSVVDTSPPGIPPPLPGETVSPGPILTVPPAPSVIPIPPLATTQYVSSPGDWAAEYYSNPDLVGPPTLVRNEVAIDFNWRFSSPASSIPVDGFSARWIRTYELEPGLYRFHIIADDGVRLWVNNDMLVDQWYPSAPREIQVDYPIRFGGLQGIRIEYADFGGDGMIRFWWEKLASPLPPPDGGIPPYEAWRGEYWPNVTLFGTPLLVRSDPSISFDWGTGSPAPGLPSNNFSARWVRLVDFEPSSYRFYLTVDDGARVWIDGQLIIDEWRDGEVREVTRDYALSGGQHEIRVEYYERAGSATVYLRWDKTPTYVTATPPTTYPDWRGEYWTNISLSGVPALVRNDPAINFNWGLGSPGVSIPPDNFSARWSRSVYFENGVYRFTAQANGGVRFYVDGTLVLNEWSDIEERTSTVELSLTGQHWLVVEYYEQAGIAAIQFRWERLTATVTPTVPTSDPTVPLTAAQIDLSNRLGVPVSQIQVISITPVEWRNSNLGCPLQGPGLEVIIPGYLIFLRAQGEQYEYHTDQGTNVILCTAVNTPTPIITLVPTPSPTATSTAVPTLTAVPIETPTLVPTLPVTVTPPIVITITLEATGTPVGTPSP